MTRPVSDTTSDGRWGIRNVAGPFEVTRLAFPPSYHQEPFSPERGYLVVVLDGAVCKTFVGDSATLALDSVSALPAGASHSSDFAPQGAQVVVIRSVADSVSELSPLLTRRRHDRVAASTALAWRLAAELEAPDSSSGLALEGLVLQLVATTSRASHETPRRCAEWVRAVREILRDDAPTPPSLSELAARVGQRPTLVARAFRSEYGMTVAQYARSVRLDWARERLAAGDTPLNQVALAAGFVDQSHFTRAFRRHTGVTPGRYRSLARRSRVAA